LTRAYVSFLVFPRGLVGISLKSQLLFLSVYVTRYLHLFDFREYDILHIYNFLMKCVFIASQATIVHGILYKYRATYNPKLDTFRVEAVVVPCLVLAFFLYHSSRWNTVFGALVEVSEKEAMEPGMCS
jgi:ER lumen protein retaining receptor